MENYTMRLKQVLRGSRLRLSGLVIATAALLAFLLLTSQQADVGLNTEPYLGQSPPGNTPQLFAKGIIPADLHSVPVFSPDKQSLYYKSMDSEDIMVIRYGRNGWKKAEVLSDVEDLDNSDDPCFNPSGEKLFFSSYSKGDNREFIYYCNRKKGGFSKPVKPEGALNNLDHHWQFSIAANGNIYYSSNGNIYFSANINNIYDEPVKLDTTINTGLSECTPYISPDEEMLIFARTENEKPDLFVSYKDENGQWLPAKNLGPQINSEHHEMCPRISPDGKYLFFISSKGGLFSAYWVDAGILDTRS